MSTKINNTPHAKNLVGELNNELKSIQEIIEDFSDQIDGLQSTKQNNLTYDAQPTENSENSVKSGGIYSWVYNSIETKTTRNTVSIQSGANASYTLTPVSKTNYFFVSPNSLSSLTISSFPSDNEEVLIYIMTGTSGCTINLPSGVNYVNSLNLSANTYYVCSILNNVFITVPTLHKS
nr:MAG TPA: hypothetical protein [Caudoviricetes sp.]